MTDQTFQAEVLASPKPVLVDYWARVVRSLPHDRPAGRGVRTEYADRLTIAKLNIDQNPAIPTRYAVRGIPTLMIFKDGHPVATHVGSLSRSQLHAFLDAHT